MSDAAGFEPGRYLTKVNGSDYLEVKWRLVWLRHDHPDAAIETELIERTDQLAVFRARVQIPGGGSATGWGSETPSDFRDYVEKAETKALGRALAALGFGTQFCPDFEFGAAAGRVVDAPIDFATTRGRRIGGDGAGDQPRVASVAKPATPRQVTFIWAIAKELGLRPDEVQEESQRRFERPVGELTARDASALIEWLQAKRGVAGIASDEPGW